MYIGYSWLHLHVGLFRNIIFHVQLIFPHFREGLGKQKTAKRVCISMVGMFRILALRLYKIYDFTLACLYVSICLFSVLQFIYAVYDVLLYIPK